MTIHPQVSHRSERRRKNKKKKRWMWENMEEKNKKDPE